MRTIQKAASLARAGDTILVRGGVYSEPVVLRFSGQKGKPIVLKNYPGERPVIQPGQRGEQPPGHAVLLQAQEGYQNPIGWITIEGFEIRYGWDGVKFYNAHDIVIRNCHIHENWNQGLLGNGNRVFIDRNIIAGNGANKDARQSLMHGIYATGTFIFFRETDMRKNKSLPLLSRTISFIPKRPTASRWRLMVTTKTQWRGRNIPKRKIGSSRITRWRSISMPRALC